MSSVTDWTAAGTDPWALVISHGYATTSSLVFPLLPAKHSYESLPSMYEWEIMGSPLQPVVQSFQSFDPIYSWDISGVALDPTSGTLAKGDGRSKYEVLSYDVHSWGLDGQAAAPNPPENLDVGTTPSITITGFAPDLPEMDMLDVPYGIDETLTGFAPTLLEGNDYGLDVPSALIQVIGFAPDIVEFSLESEALLVPTADITILADAPDLVDQEFLDVATTPSIQFLANAPTLDEQALLPPIISIADAQLIAEYLLDQSYLESGITLRMALRALCAAAAGETIGNPVNAGSFAYLAIGQGAVGPIRVQGTTDRGTRTNVVVTG